MKDRLFNGFLILVIIVIGVKYVIYQFFDDSWATIISSLLGSGGLVWVILTKWGDNWFEKKNKKYQAELDRMTNEMQEKLRIEYGSLYPKRVEAIEGIYQGLYKLCYHLEKGPNLYLDPSREHSLAWYGYFKIIIEQVNKLKTSIAMNLIYFSREDSDKLEEIDIALTQFLKESNKCSMEIKEEQSIADDRNVDIGQEINDIAKSFFVENKEILNSEKIHALIPIIYDRFRELVGVNENKTE